MMNESDEKLIVGKYYKSFKAQKYYLEFVNEKLKNELSETTEDDYYNSLDVHKTLFLTNMILYSFLRNKDYSEENIIELEAVISTNLPFSEEISIKEILINNEYSLKRIMPEIFSLFSTDFANFSIELEYDDSKELYLFPFKFKNVKGREGINNIIEKKKKHIEQERLLFETAIINSTNAFETLIYDLLVNFAKKNPEFMNKKDSNLRVSDIINSPNIDSLKQKILDNYIKDILWDNRKRWFKELRIKNKNFSKKFLSEDEDEVEKIFKIRNSIVHNEGKLNEECLTIFEGKKIGEKIPLNYKTTVKYTENLFYLGFKISYYLLTNSKENINENLNFFEQEFGLDLIKINADNLAEKIYTLMWNERSIGNADYIARLSLNYALSLKKQGKKFEEIIMESDLSVKNHEHELCYAALIGDHKEVIKMFDLVMKYNDKTNYFHNLIDWPVLEEVIQTDDFKNFVLTEYSLESEFYYPNEEIEELMSKN